jgi:hypothetical protein
VRHPDNGLSNLVATHARCNNAKRDSLASARHLERWLGRDQRALDEVCGALSWPSNRDRTLGAVRANYLWLPDGTPLWQGVGVYARANADELRRLLTNP